MIRFGLIALALSASAMAAPVSVDFDSVPLPVLARLVATELGAGSYAFTPAFEENTKRVSLRLKRVDPAVLEETVYRLVESEGFTVKRGPVVWIEKPSEQKDFVYRPRYRSAAYLADMITPFFKGIAAASASAVSSVPSESGPSASAMPAVSMPVNAMQSASSADIEKRDVVAYRGLVSDVARLEKLLAQLDVASPELLVKAVVYEVSKTEGESSAMSVALSLLGGHLGIKAGRAVAGDWSAVFKNSSVSAIFNALSTDSRFKVVSQPQLRVTSGGSAKLTVGTQTPVLGGSQMDRNGNVVQNVDYKPSGVILGLKPDVRDGLISMAIDQQISQFSATTNGVNQTPTLITRHVETTVTLTGEEVLVLGGLNEEKTQGGTSGVSWLPDFLRSKTDSRENTEVLIFLQAFRI